MNPKEKADELTQKFTEIFAKNEWGSHESVSGTGSELRNTEVLRKELQFLFLKYQIKSILDIPCGDFNWMQHVDLEGIMYHGSDIVPEIIAKNKKLYPEFSFGICDITTDILLPFDLVIVRDMLGHFSDINVMKALENIRRSGSKYLLATSFTKWDRNPDISDGQWKCINLMLRPYYLRPIYLINEDCREVYPDYNDKCMILIDLKNMYCKH